ncbi:hypothetical protein [Bacillus cereus]|uniref:hypothetical protein n=1 Tax=Bacillus cereus TaxID=1396 RepID=UPI000B4BC483|nr:hypothetical protein [Bacillus cereus]
MKTYIWVRNVDGKLFQIFNTNDGVLELANKLNFELLGCDKTDLIYYAQMIGKNLPDSRLTYEVIHQTNDEKESLEIKRIIELKLKEKSELMKRKQVLKKMLRKSSDKEKESAVTFLIQDVESDLRNIYFEISIPEILEGMKKQLQN